MSITTNPYLTFPENNTREAMTFYAQVFGGEPTFLPLAGMEGVPDDDTRVMHSELRAPEITLMASDNCMGEELKPGSNLFTIAFMADPADEPRAREIFDALAQGGTVQMPLQAQMWGDLYGMVTDRFGVQWAVNVAQPH